MILPMNCILKVGEEIEAAPIPTKTGKYAGNKSRIEKDFSDFKIKIKINTKWEIRAKIQIDKAKL